jgi:hypothetical protein
MLFRQHAGDPALKPVQINEMETLSVPNYLWGK